MVNKYREVPAIVEAIRKTAKKAETKASEEKKRGLELTSFLEMEKKEKEESTWHSYLNYNLNPQDSFWPSPSEQDPLSFSHLWLDPLIYP